MHISDKGLDIIKEFEGYGRQLPNGDCTAYQEHLGGGKYDIPTIGWGCTEGVTMGMVWTRQQAEDGLRHELVKKEDAVLRQLKFVPTQNQFDALVSFTYNVGEGALAKSTVLRLANAGDFVGASKAFGMWNKAQGIVVGGLVRRRAEEAALFMKLDNPADSLGMVQKVDEPSEGSSDTIATTTQGGLVTTGGAVGMMHYFGLDPMGVMTLVKSYPVPVLISVAVILYVAVEAFKHFKGDH